MMERSLDRKIKEAYYAYILEERLSKDQILEAYLNTVNFGSGYGIASAARDYFDKDVKDLTLAEGAALACMPNAPSYYALVLTLYSNDLGEFADKVLYTDGDFSYCWNDRCKDRMDIYTEVCEVGKEESQRQAHGQQCRQSFLPKTILHNKKILSYQPSLLRIISYVVRI